MRQIKIETTPEAKWLNYAIETLDGVTFNAHANESDPLRLARIAEGKGLELSAKILREYATIKK